MNPEYLRSFPEICHSGSYTRAAARLALSQPALSRQMNLLERDLGTEILSRDKSGARPTAAGEQLRRDALALLRLEQSARERIRGSSETRIRIGCGQTVASRLLPRFLSRSGSGARVRVIENDQPGILHDLLHGKTDLAISDLQYRGEGFTALPLCRDEIVAVHGTSQRWKRPRDAAGQPFLLFHEDSSIRKISEARLRATGFWPVEVKMELRSLAAVESAVRSRLGIGFLSSFGLGTGIRRLPFDDWNSERILFVLLPESEPGENLLQFAEDFRKDFSSAAGGKPAW